MDWWWVTVIALASAWAGAVLGNVDDDDRGTAAIFVGGALFVVLSLAVLAVAAWFFGAGA